MKQAWNNQNKNNKNDVYKVILAVLFGVILFILGFMYGVIFRG